MVAPEHGTAVAESRSNPKLRQHEADSGRRARFDRWSQDRFARIRSISEKSLTTKLELSALEARRDSLEDTEKSNDAARIAATLWAAKSGYGTDKKDLPAAYREYLKTEIQEKQGLLKNLAGMMEREAANLKLATASETEMKNASSDVARNRQLFEETIKLVHQVDLRRSDEGYDMMILSKPAAKPVVNGRDRFGFDWQVRASRQAARRCGNGVTMAARRLP